MTPLLAVAMGGAAGSLLRFGLQNLLNSRFPAGTLLINLLGCFCIGLLWALQKGMNENLRLLLMTGFCGGFTTFSAFAFENLQLMLTGRWLAAATYTTASVVGGIAAAALAYKIFHS